MQIAGIQKLTLVDFPGTVAATIFTRGCSFRCGFCHNPELVLPEKFNLLLPEQQIFDFLESRYGKLTGICITGGEPLFQSDCDKFISHVKALGFKVKLDTNGSFPERLEKIIKDGDVDYLAMDIKSSIPKYKDVTKVEVVDKIKKSIKLIMASGIDYEFRTTVCHPLHNVADFEEMGQMIRDAKRYFIQNYKQTKQVDENKVYKSFSDKELKEAKKIMLKYVGEVGIR